MSTWMLSEGTGSVVTDLSGRASGSLLNTNFTINTGWTVVGQPQPFAVRLLDATAQPKPLVVLTAGYTLQRDFTVSMWVRPESAQQIDAESLAGVDGAIGQRFVVGPCMSAGCDAAGQVQLGISVGSNGVGVYQYGANGSVFSALLSHYTMISEWTLVTVAVAGNKPRLYLNGSFVGEGLTAADTVAFTPSTFGSALWSFDGLLSTVRVWSGVLSDDVIAGFGALLNTQPGECKEVEA